MSKKNYTVCARIKTTSSALRGMTKKPQATLGVVQNAQTVIGSFAIRWKRTNSFKAKNSNHIVEQGYLEVLHIGLDEEYEEQRVVETVTTEKRTEKQNKLNNVPETIIDDEVETI
jgi:hypothetical protein